MQSKIVRVFKDMLIVSCQRAEHFFFQILCKSLGKLAVHFGDRFDNLGIVKISTHIGFCVTQICGNALLHGHSFGNFLGRPGLSPPSDQWCRIQVPMGQGISVDFGFPDCVVRNISLVPHSGKRLSDCSRKVIVVIGFSTNGKLSQVDVGAFLGRGFNKQIWSTGKGNFNC